MHSISAIVAAMALFATISGSPIEVRSTCGTAPSGSGNQKPISQPAGINTAAGCEAQCKANSACSSFVFGTVSNKIECMLYSVAAAMVPKQSSSNLIAYDKACTSVPAVVPTASNPAGSPNGKRANTCGSAPTAAVAEQPIAQPASIATLAACETQCNDDSACLSYVFGTVSSKTECMLYSVAATSIPRQSSTSLLAYDKACSVAATATAQAAPKKTSASTPKSITSTPTKSTRSSKGISKTV